MEIEYVDYTMQVPKESKEVVDLLSAIAKKAIAKAELTDYMELLGGLTVALDGVQKVKEEVDSEGRDEIAGYLVHKLMSDLAPVKEV